MDYKKEAMKDWNAMIPRSWLSWPFFVGFAGMELIRELLVGDMGDEFVKMKNQEDPYYFLKVGLVDGAHDQARWVFWNGFGHSDIFKKMYAE